MRGVGAVQAAEFLGCKKLQEDIVKHLKRLLVEMTKRSEEIAAAPQQGSADRALSLAFHHGYSRDWHTVQVWACIALLHLQSLE
jgi:hypothetical protein